MARIKAIIEMFLRTLAITVIKRATMPKIILRQKTSYTLGNFYISDYLFRV